MPNLDKYRIPWEKTSWSCSLDELNFQCTDELAPLDHFIGQRRALESIRFGLEVDKPGYNLFVTGLTGTGKASAVKAHVQGIIEELRQREQLKPISDWCYVHNFEDPDRPRALRIPRGPGRPLRRRLEQTLRRVVEPAVVPDLDGAHVGVAHRIGALKTPELSFA